MSLKEHTEAAEADRRSELDAARAEMGRKSDGAVFAALEAREAELATLHAAAVDALDARHAGAVADAAAAHARLAAAAAAEHRDTVARQHAFQEETREAALTIQAKRHDGNLFSALRAREEELTAAFDKILKEREAAFVEAEASFERAMKDQQDAHAKTIGDLEAQLLAFERAGPPLPPREKTVCCAGGSPAT